MAEKDFFAFEIRTSICAIFKSSKSWNKDLIFVVWNGRKGKPDIQKWTPEHRKPKNVVSLFEEELRTLGKLTNQKINRLDRIIFDVIGYEEL